MNELSLGAVSGGAREIRHAWTAEMIRPKTDEGNGTPSSFLTKTVSLGRPTGAEVLRISALGLYVCFINGKRVGNDLLTPGWTCYDARLSYQTYTVGELLREGENRIDIWLGDGWFRSQLMRMPALFNVWGRDVAAVAELSDASGAVVLRTDGTWRSGLLPVRRSGIYFGEIFDARIEPLATDGVEPVAFDTARLIPHEIDPVRELSPLAAIRQWQDEGRTIYDFGQNSAGYVAIEVRGAAGARVHVEHGEVLDERGNFYNENFRSAEARLEYILAGRGIESYRPFFTFQGFRFARVRIEGDAELVSIVSIPISSVTRPTGAFTSGNPLVNRLVENTLWSQRTNFIEVPTDCPQRDERLGWTGDAQVFASTACYLHDSHRFFVKFLRDVMADQREDGAISYISPDPTRVAEGRPYPIFHGSTGWGDAICVIPWTLYLHYGDRDILAEALPAMVRWVDFVWSISDGPIVHPPRERMARGFTFGDWLQPGGPTNKPWPTIGDDAAATIYLFIASDLTARIAGLLGEIEIERRMADRARAVKAAFEHEFIAPSGRLTYDDQTSYALAILYDLLPERHLDAARRYFKAAIARTEGRIGTGFIGTPALLPALVKIGEYELAARMFLQEEVPGWLFQVKMGATTVWERWDSLKADGSINGEQMNSYNHYAYGAVCQWLFEAVAGFRPDPDEPAFRHVIFEPTIIPELSPVAAHHDAATGRIEAGWAVENGEVTYSVTVPREARGTLRLPKRYGSADLDGRPLPAGTSAELRPGRHTVRFRLD